jgi:hypothetical protein
VFVIRLPSRSLGEGWCFVIPSSFVIRLPSRSLGEGWCFGIRSMSFGQARDFEAVTA